MKEKVEARRQQVDQGVTEKVESGQGDLKQKVDGVQKDVDDLQAKVNELLEKVDAQEKQDQKAKK